MQNSLLFSGYHFQSTAQLLIGAFSGTVAGVILVFWLGENMDKIITDIRFISQRFWKRKIS